MADALSGGKSSEDGPETVRSIVAFAAESLLDVMIKIRYIGERYPTETYDDLRQDVDAYERHVASVARAAGSNDADALKALYRLLAQMSEDKRFRDAIRVLDDALYARHQLTSRLFDDYKEARKFAKARYDQGRAIDLGARATPAARLIAAVPTQKSAPLRFIVPPDDVVRLDRVPADPSAGAERVSDHAREELERSCEELKVRLLASGNIDARIVLLVEQLGERIAARDNIVQLGMAGISADLVFTAAKEELPDAIAGMLAGFTRSISMYVAQFSDWQIFVENAAAADLAEIDVGEVRESGERFAAELEAMPERVDPEVPKSIRFLLALLRDPKQTTKRALFAIIRTFENFISAAVRRAGKLADAMLDGAADGAKKGSGKVVYAALLTLAVGAGVAIWPAASKLVDAKWIGEVVEAAKQQLPKID